MGLRRLGAGPGPRPEPENGVPPGAGSPHDPAVPQLRPYLEAVLDLAEPGTTHVISRHRLGIGQSADPITEDHGPGGREAVAPAVPEHKGEPGDGAVSPTPLARGH